MYIYWKPLLLLGLIFWIIINSADVLQRKLSLFPITADPSTLSNPSDKSIEIEKTVSTTSVEQVGSKEILDSSPGYAVLFANIFIFVFSLIFCSLAKFFVRIVYLGFRRTDVPNIDESQEITPTSQMSHIIEAVAVTSSESAICSEKRSLIIDTSCPNLTMKMNNQSHQTCQTMFHTPLFTKNEQVLKAECSKLREELLALHSNSIKEHALLSRKLDSMTKEKRELSKRLTVVQKENQVAKTQLDELMNDKNMLQKRLENATKDFRVNTKTKKVALAKLEEISSTVDDLKRQLEQVTRDKEILQGKLQVLRTEYEQMEERLHMMQLKETDRINEERAISLESEKAERDESINSKIDDKIIEDQSTCQSSQSSLNRIISKENVFLPYVISQTEVNMKNIQTKILELEKSLKEFNSKPDIRCDSINEIKAEPDSEKDDFVINSEIDGTRIISPRGELTCKNTYDQIKVQLLRSALKEKIKVLENMKEKEEDSLIPDGLSEGTTGEDEFDLSSEENTASPRIVSNSLAFQKFLKNIGAENKILSIGDTKFNSD